MRIDNKRVDKITNEMKLNDRLYYLMRKELDDHILEIVNYYPDGINERFEELFFYRRVISILENHDLPFKCALGYYDLVDRLEFIENKRHEYLCGDESDEEIFKFILELGYELYDKGRDER